MAKARHAYELSLPSRPATDLLPPVAGVSFRVAAADDAEALAVLMLDSYRGTIDDEGETLDDARREVGQWVDRAPLFMCSFVGEAEGRPVAASLALMNDGVPWVAYVITDPAWKSRGVGGAVLQCSLSALEAAGYSRVRAAITEGNVPSERMCARAGFEKLV